MKENKKEKLIKIALRTKQQGSKWEYNFTLQEVRSIWSYFMVQTLVVNIKQNLKESYGFSKSIVSDLNFLELAIMSMVLQKKYKAKPPGRRGFITKFRQLI